MDRRMSLVIATRNRRESLRSTLERSLALPESPRVILVDNGSCDDTVEFVRAAYPAVQVLAMPENRGAAARTIGVRSAETPYVAFSDDDSWWAPGSLSRTADWLNAHPDLALVAGAYSLVPSRLSTRSAWPWPPVPWAPAPACPGPLC